MNASLSSLLARQMSVTGPLVRGIHGSGAIPET